MTTIAGQGSAPTKAAATEEMLAHLHLPGAEAGQTFSEGKPDTATVPSQDKTAGASCLGIQAPLLCTACNCSDMHLKAPYHATRGVYACTETQG